MNFLRGQEQVSQKRALPVNEANSSPTVATSASATVQLYYYSAGVRTSDAGEAAGTVVDATFANKNILNSLGTNVATKSDTSLAYTCLALTTELEISAEPEIETLLESLDNATPAVRAEIVGAKLQNGEFVIDYRRGFLIGKKATTASTMTGVTYQYSAGVIISAFPSGTGSIAIAEDTAETAGEIIVKAGRVRRDTAASSAGTSGDWSTANNDSLGHDWVREGYAAGAEDNTNGVFATVRKAISVSTYAPTAVQSNSFTTTNAKASSGNVYGFIVINTSGSDRYLQLHNTATTPGGGATAAFKFLVPAGTMLVLSENDWGGPLTFTTGIAYANSTAAATYTAGTAGDLLLDLFYK